jgi:CIC family chloride channel protein
MDFEFGAFLYTMLSSAVAYTVNGLFVGFQPLFRVPPIPIPALQDYLWYAGLGVVSGFAGTLLPVVFYRVRDMFHRVPIPLWTKPVVSCTKKTLRSWLCCATVNS